MYYLLLLQIVLGIFALFLLWQTVTYTRDLLLRKRIAHIPFPRTYLKILEHIPHYKALPEPLKTKLHRSILYFIQTKEFLAVGMELTDEMRVVIAFYACLMQLRLDEGCYPSLRTIVIYPHDVIAKEVRADGGIYTKERFILEGQSSGGTVVIAWNEARREAYHPRRHNVIVHELAHELDAQEGAFDGTPPLPPGRYQAWAEVVYPTYKRLKGAIQKGRYLDKYALLGRYAATNEAEFFAVVSELFFERPQTLKKHFPDLYRELESFYRLDTAQLFEGLS